MISAFPNLYVSRKLNNINQAQVIKNKMLKKLKIIINM